MASSRGASATAVAAARGAAKTPRWRTAARFLFRSLSLRGSTFLLALLAIAVGATLTATMLDIRADLGAKMSHELRRFGPNLLLTPHLADDAAGTSTTLAASDATRARAAIESAGYATGGVVSPLLLVTGAVAPDVSAPGDAAVLLSARPPGLPVDARPATVMGADFEPLRRLYPSWRLVGAWPAPGETACVLGASLAARAGLAAGGRALVAVRGSAGGPRRMTVAGIVSTGESEDEAVFVPLALLQDEIGLPGRISLAAISVDGGADAVSRAAIAAATAVPGASARPLRQIAASQGAILGKLGRMMLLLTIVVMTLSGLCLVTTLMTSVVERENEIGLMRSIGAGDFEIVSMFVGEVLLLGIGGGIIGILLGALCARIIGTRLFDAAIAPRAEVVPLVLAISVVLCLVSVLVPLRRALAIAPAAALRGD